MESVSLASSPPELSCLLDFTSNFTQFFETCFSKEPESVGSQYFHDKLIQESPHGLYGLACEVIASMLNHARGLDMVPPVDMVDISQLEHNLYVRETLFDYDTKNPQLTMHYRPTPSHREMDVQNLFEDMMVAIIENWLMSENQPFHALGIGNGQVPEDRVLWRLITSLVVDTAVAASALFREHGVSRNLTVFYRNISFQPTRYNPYIYALIFSHVD